MNIWKRVSLARDDQPAELQEAVDLLAQWTERSTQSVDVRRLANLIGLGYSARDAAVREYRYALGLAISSSYLPSHCIWSGHAIGM